MDQNNRRSIVAVIPAAGDCGDLVIQCVTHLERSLGVDLSAVIVNNGCPRRASEDISAHAHRSQIPVAVIDFPENRGFTHAVNLGIALADGSDMLLLNDDCFVAPNCVRRLQDHLAPDVAAVGPLTNDNGRQSLQHGRRQHKSGWGGVSPNGKTVEEVEAKLTEAVVTDEPMLSFFCALLSRDALEAIGPLDDHEDFASGLCADDDWCSRARAAGARCLLVHNAYAAHLHSETFRRLGIDRSKEHRRAIGRLNGAACA